MRLVKSILIISLTYFTFVSFSIASFFGFILPDLNNNPVSFHDHKKNKATAVIFLLSDCPASESYTLTLNKLAEKYEKDSVGFIGVFPGKFSTDDELRKFQNDYKVSFPLYKDSAMTLVKFLKATIAPQCFVLDGEGQIVYKGRIDDWLYALGKKKTAITENNLDDAISSVVNNTFLKVKETNPIGCILEYE